MIRRKHGAGGDRGRVNLYLFPLPRDWTKGAAEETYQEGTSPAPESVNEENAGSVTSDTPDSVDPDTRVITEGKTSHHLISLDDDEDPSLEEKSDPPRGGNYQTRHDHTRLQQAASTAATSEEHLSIDDCRSPSAPMDAQTSLMPHEWADLVRHIAESRLPESSKSPVRNVAAYACRSLEVSHMPNRVATQWSDTVKVLVEVGKHRDALRSLRAMGDLGVLAWMDLANSLAAGTSCLLPQVADTVVEEFNDYLRARCQA